VGLAYGLAVGQRAGGSLDSGMAAAALGVSLWAVVSGILLPLTAGEEFEVVKGPLVIDHRPQSRHGDAVPTQPSGIDGCLCSDTRC
jgi:hypothetical protein